MSTTFMEGIIQSEHSISDPFLFSLAICSSLLRLTHNPPSYRRGCPIHDDDKVKYRINYRILLPKQQERDSIDANMFGKDKITLALIDCNSIRLKDEVSNKVQPNQ